LTTPETIAAERATVEHVQRGQNTVAPIMSEERAASHAAALEILNPAERRAIEAMLASRDQIHGLQGLAGAGKNDHARSYPRSCPAQRLRRRGLRPDCARRSTTHPQR
jgi:hypothetical protein